MRINTTPSPQHYLGRYLGVLSDQNEVLPSPRTRNGEKGDKSTWHALSCSKQQKSNPNEDQTSNILNVCLLIACAVQAWAPLISATNLRPFKTSVYIPY